jgi:hypothetical protein
MAKKKISDYTPLTSLTGNEILEAVHGGDNRSLTVQLLGKFFGFVTPEMFGAEGDGTSNDYAALQQAIDSGYSVRLGSKTYKTLTTLVAGPSAFIEGCGDESVLYTNSDTAILQIVGDAVDDSDVYLSNLAFLGTATGSNQHGLVIESTGADFFTRNRLHNVNFYELGGSGLYSVKDTIDFKGSIYATNCYAQGCGTGFFIDDASEYNHFSNCVAYANTIGVKFIGGNNTWNGGGINDNDLGIQMTGPFTNEGKCIFSNCSLNHNTRLMDLDGIREGVLFEGNYMIFGDWLIVDSDKVTFTDNTIDTQSEDIVITNCDFMEFHTNTFKIDHNFVITGTVPRFLGNTWQSGNVPSEVHNSMMADLALRSTDSFVLGDPSVDGSWRLTRSGNNLVRQRREAGVWVTKGTDTP